MARPLFVTKTINKKSTKNFAVIISMYIAPFYNEFKIKADWG